MKNPKLLILLQFLLPAFLYTTVETTYASNSCRKALSHKVKIGIKEEQGLVLVNNVMVTGDIHYSFSDVKKHLNLDQKLTTKWKNEDATVVSLAEGVSLLVPSLLKQGVKAYGVDLWYNDTLNIPNNLMGELMLSYINVYGDHLIAGDARHLDFKDESIDVVLSHNLVNNLHIADVFEVITETLRVLKIGGEARIYGFSQKKMNAVTNFIAANFQKEVNNFSFNQVGLFTYQKKSILIWPQKIISGWDRDTAYDNGDLSGPLARPLF
jgi:hypothetical protein